MPPRPWRICVMGTDVDEIKRPTYKKVKEHVLKAGRFSVFEATSTQQLARIFDRMMRDPELEFDNKVNFSFPWTGVRKKRKSRAKKQDKTRRSKGAVPNVQEGKVVRHRR